MLKQEPDDRLVEDLIFYYTEKKRLSVRTFTYIATPANDGYIRKAAALCAEFELDAATYVQVMYERMGSKKEYFAPKYMQGEKARYYLKDEQENYTDLKVEITNANLDPVDIWRHQHELAMLYIRRGESVESVLMDSSLKFFGWFRILATPNRYEPIISKYKHIAKKELTSRLKDFMKNEKLDTDRLL